MFLGASDQRFMTWSILWRTNALPRDACWWDGHKATAELTHRVPTLVMISRTRTGDSRFITNVSQRALYYERRAVIYMGCVDRAIHIAQRPSWLGFTSGKQARLTV